MAAEGEVACVLRQWGFERFIPAFEQQGINSLDMLRAVSMKDLKNELGMSVLGDRLRFKKLADELASRSSGHVITQPAASSSPPAGPSDSTEFSWLPQSFYKFDVFLSHRGSDAKFKENVKMDLAVPLYYHLESSFTVFLDKFGLSTSIPSHGMLNALVTCDMGVIFFSRGFVDGIFNGTAPWCLLELRVLYAKHQWLHHRELQKKGTSGAAPRPKIFGVAVSPYQIDDLWDGEHATTPLPMVTHEDLVISDFQLDALRGDLAARSPKLVEFMDDSTITLQKLLGQIPFIALNGTDSTARMEMFQEIKKRLIELREQKKNRNAPKTKPGFKEEVADEGTSASIEQDCTDPRQTELVQNEADSTEIGEQAGFNPIVYGAAKSGDVERLLEALASHEDLIDTPHPRKRQRTPLYIAAMKGHAQMVEKLVELGSQAIDISNESGWTPLNAAASNGHVSVIETLVRLGSKTVDTPNNEGWTPLNMAAWNGHVSVIELLVRLGSKAIDTPSNDGSTPLNAAAWNGHVSVIETLVRSGSNAINAPDNVGRTPMYAAARNGHVSVIELLVRLGSKAIDTPNKYGWTPLFAAALKGHVSAIELLVRLGSKAIDTPNNDGCAPLYAAASKGHVSVIETLVRLGSNAIDTPGNNDCTPMYASASSGHVSVIEALVRLGSKAIDTPNEHGCTPLRAAASNGQVSVIELLVQLGSKAIDTPDNIGRTPLFAAALKDHVSAIEALVQLGSEAIDTPNKDGWTPMHAAACEGRVSAIETLVRLGSNAVDTPNYDGWTPMFAAACEGHVSAIETLVRLGSKAIDTPDKYGCTPMSIAARYGNVSVIERLITLGSQTVDLPDNDGRTPLHAATLEKQIEAIKTLLCWGSQAINMQDENGATPLDLALELEDGQEVLDLLLASVQTDPE